MNYNPAAVLGTSAEEIVYFDNLEDALLFEIGGKSNTVTNVLALQFTPLSVDTPFESIYERAEITEDKTLIIAAVSLKDNKWGWIQVTGRLRENMIGDMCDMDIPTGKWIYATSYRSFENRSA